MKSYDGGHLPPVQSNNFSPEFSLPKALDSIPETLGIADPVKALKEPSMGPTAVCKFEVKPAISPPRNCSAAQRGTFTILPSNSFRNLPTKLLRPFIIFSIAQ